MGKGGQVTFIIQETKNEYYFRNDETQFNQEFQRLKVLPARVKCSSEAKTDRLFVTNKRQKTQNSTQNSFVAFAKKSTSIFKSSRTAFVDAFRFLFPPIFVDGNLLQCSLKTAFNPI